MTDKSLRRTKRSAESRVRQVGSLKTHPDERKPTQPHDRSRTFYGDIDRPDYLEGKCAFGEQCMMKGYYHDESKLAVVQTPPQEMHSQHFESDAVLDNSSVEHFVHIWMS